MEGSGLAWAVCGSLACRGIGPTNDGLYREVRVSAEGYDLSALIFMKSCYGGR